MPQDKGKNEGNKRGKDTNNKGVHTEVIFEDETLHDQLRNVIELMGPSTPNFKSTSEDDSCGCTISEIKDLSPRPDQRIIFDYDNNTPRDVSNYSSIPTDTVDVYLEPKTCLQNIPMQINTNTHYQQYPVPNSHLPSCHGAHQLSNKKDTGTFEKISSFLNLKQIKQKESVDLYRINILQHKNDNCPPKKVVFDLVDEIPKPIQNNAATNTQDKVCWCNAETNTNLYPKVDKSCNGFSNVYDNPPKHCYSKSGINICKSTSGMVVKHKISERSGRMHKETFYEPTIDRSTNTLNYGNMARVDVYYFDHGNSAYYHTTDSPPVIVTEIIAEKTENYTTKFWAEVFGTVHIGFSFLTSFVLQLFRFLLQSLLRPLTVGLLQLGSDYFFKPLLATLFNAVLQPILIFIYNIMTSIRDIMDPIAEGIGYFLREMAVLLRAIRLIDYRPGLKCDCTKENERRKSCSKK